MNTLFLDLDGVFANFELCVFEQTGKFAHQFENPESMYAALKPGFYLDMPETFYFDALYNGIKEIAEGRNMRLCVLTGIPRVRSYPTAREEKREWVSKRMPEVDFAIGPYSADKWKHGAPGDILLDDRPDNVNDWKRKAGARAVLFVYPGWNTALRELRSL